MTGALATLPPPDVVLGRPGGTVVLRPAPRREPPFDDELDQRIPTGPLDRPLPFDEWRPARRPLTRLPAPPRRTVPDPAVWARRLLVGLIEAAAGRRPLHQLSILLSSSVAHGLHEDFERAARTGDSHWLRAAKVRSVRSSEPADQVAELSATAVSGRRVHAIALRLEVRRGRWCCTRLMLG